MPKLTDTLHLDMLQTYKKNRRADSEADEPGIYGIHWGDPDSRPYLRRIRDHLLLKYVNKNQTAVEIGPGGGRWTKYMVDFGRLYCVDYHQELLDELRKTYDCPNMVFVRNNGNDFPGIPSGSVDFLFSFGVFVHLNVDIIATYLASMKRLLKPSACAVIQYSDKRKEAARRNRGFSENNPDIMRGLVTNAGYTILEEDLDTLPHSAVIRFSLPC